MTRRGPQVLTGCCTTQEPLTLQVQGPRDLQRGVVFSGQYPCGASQDLTTFAQTRMRVLSRWSGCIGDDKPGARALVTGHVLALDSVRDQGGQRPQINGCTPEVRSSESNVKLRITACGQPGPTIIDSDSALVVPSGMTTIEVIAPQEWSIGTSGPDADEIQWTDLDLRIAGCPCECGFNPKGYLTEVIAFDIGGSVADRILVRPRRARKLEATGAVAATGATANLGMQHVMDVTGSTVLAQTVFQAGFPLELDVGSIAYFLPVSLAGTTRATLRWEIE